MRQHVIADMSLHHLAYIIASCTFTTEPTRADYGYDLSVFTFDEKGSYENGNIFVQLKATDRLTIDATLNEAKIRISKRDLLTWEGEPFPVYLVVFDAGQRKAYAIYLQRYLAEAGLSALTMASASAQVRLPLEDVTEATIQQWRAEKNAVLARMGAMIHV